jgi:hypothetical protein
MDDIDGSTRAGRKGELLADIQKQVVGVFSHERRQLPVVAQETSQLMLPSCGGYVGVERYFNWRVEAGGAYVETALGESLVEIFKKDTHATSCIEIVGEIDNYFKVFPVAWSCGGEHDRLSLTSKRIMALTRASTN